MYSNAQWVDIDGQHLNIRVDLDGQTLFVPIAPGNRHYDAIMALVEAGELIIADAEEVE